MNDLEHDCQVFRPSRVDKSCDSTIKDIVSRVEISDWEQEADGGLKQRVVDIIEDIRHTKTVLVNRCYFTTIDDMNDVESVQLHGFGETSNVALVLMFMLECKRKRKHMLNYSMFHVTWITFKFNRNQPGTVSAFVMISVPWSNQRANQVISEKLLSKEFHCRTTDQK